MRKIPKSELTPFSMLEDKEVSKNDDKFVRRIMMMDWKDIINVSYPFVFETIFKEPSAFTFGAGHSVEV